MADDNWLTEQFEASRPRLRALAYRMLGSRAEADDAVQETWLRLARVGPSSLDNPGGWLTTVVARVCLDRLRSRRARGEDLIAPEIADDAEDMADDSDPVHQALVAESVGAALLVVLDSLAPAERVAFVLHDVFAVPFDEISQVLERTPDATRQLASRARRRVQGTAPTGAADPVRQREVVEAFLQAARGGDFEALVQLLDPDVVLRPDAAAVRMGSLREAHGAVAVATMMSGNAQGAHLAIVDGMAGLVWAPRGRTRGVIEFTLRDGRIASIELVGDAKHLNRLDIVALDH